MKTQNEILTNMFRLLETLPINDLNGKVYKKTRPTGSKLEDCVISVIPGVRGKFIQDGALYFKIFYNDIFIAADNTYVEDALNGQAKEQLLINLSNTLFRLGGYSFVNDYSFSIESRETYTEAVPELHQHYAILKINFQIL